MASNIRRCFRIFVCTTFIVSLYGGMTFLTAAMFAQGFVILGILSGLVLSAMTAMALGLLGLAWSMTGLRDEEPEDPVDYLAQPG